MPAEARRMTDAEFEASYGGGLASWDESAQGNAYGNLYREALAARAEARTLRGCLAALQEASAARAGERLRVTQEEWDRWNGQLAEEAGEEARCG